MLIQKTIAKELSLQKLHKIQLSDKWKIASMIWHSESEVKILKELMRQIDIQGKSVCDIACGTGFHSILLSNFGYDVVAIDVDKGNVNHFYDVLDQNKHSITIRQADWKNIDEILSNTFDVVLCLGSSITYFESWQQGSRVDLNNRTKGLVKVLKNFKKLLAKNGKVVIGYSKHYPEDKSYEVVKFPSKNGYEMEWILNFDWERKVKNWKCKLIDFSGNDLSFELQSHLYSKQEFVEICKKVFTNVEILDIDKDYYDEFIVCN